MPYFRGPRGERAPPFDESNAREHGQRGGLRAAELHRQRKVRRRALARKGKACPECGHRDPRPRRIPPRDAATGRFVPGKAELPETEADRKRAKVTVHDMHGPVENWEPWATPRKRPGPDKAMVKREARESPPPQSSPRPTFTIHRGGVGPSDGSAHVQHREPWPPPPEMIEELRRRGYDVIVAL